MLLCPTAASVAVASSAAGLQNLASNCWLNCVVQAILRFEGAQQYFRCESSGQVATWLSLLLSQMTARRSSTFVYYKFLAPIVRVPSMSTTI